MQTIKSEIMLPRQAWEDIDVAKRQNQRYLIVGPDRGQLGACPNCLGMENVMLRFVKAGPYQNAPATNRPETSTWLADPFTPGWYRVESRFYPCPACTDPRSRIEYLFSKSGLERGEREWRIDFIDGMDSKVQALVKARDILAMVPRPTGWVIFHGPYGRGKSGLLKAIVAQCIIAGTPATYLRAADLLREVRSSYSEETSLSENDIVERYGACQLLAIDEIDRISSTAWAMSTLMAVMDMRYNRRETHCTLMATNSDPDNMPAGFEYLASRMKDGDRTPIGGKDLRG